MKFKKLGIEIQGSELYILADCEKTESIKAKILQWNKSHKDKKTKDSVPPKWRPDNSMNEFYNTIFGK